MAERPARDFFISYTATDVSWAEWIAATLEQNGYSVVLQEWDFRPGGDFVQLMQQATRESRRTLAVLSPRYFESGFGEAEWRAAFMQDPGGQEGRLVPVRVEPCVLQGLLASRIFIDLVDLDEATAHDRLLDGVEPVRPRRTTAPFPGTVGRTGRSEASARFPGPAAGPDKERRHIGAPYAGGVGSGAMRGGPDARAAPERTPWEWLRRHRPSIVTLLGDNGNLLGHGGLRQELRARLDAPDTATLVQLMGPAGSGKSSLVRWLGQLAGDRLVDVGAQAQLLPRALRDDGEDVGRLVRALRADVQGVGHHAMLVYDDVDHDLREPGIMRFVHEAISQLNPESVVLSTSTQLTPQLFPIPVAYFSLDRRRARADEYDTYLNHLLDAAGVRQDAFTAELRQSLYDMAEQTPNFRAVQYVIEMLLAQHRWSKVNVGPAVLRSLLDFDPKVQQFQIPAVRAQRGPRLRFRRKDKSELLAEVLLRHFQAPGVLADVAEGGLDDFDAAAFLEEASESFLAAVMSLCLTYSPRDLVLLLGQEEIRQEIDTLRLDPEQLLDDRTEEAHLLVRGLGFTLVDTPKGLNDFKKAVQDARALVEDEDARPNVINAAGKAVIQYVEAALLDLLHFWATHLFESVRNLVKEVNASRPDGDAIDAKRLARGEVVELLSFLNDSAETGTSPYRLLFPEPSTPVSVALLQACDAFVYAADSFQSAQRSAAPGVGSGALKARCGELVAAAAEVLQSCDGAFPAVIKLSEIVFDEYSRKIFRGVDADNNEIRFALTDSDMHEDLVVAAHYFLLPKKRVVVNPHIVPRGGGTAQLLFDRAEAYAESSSTQRRQAVHLLDLVRLTPEDTVIDVGCGTGALALDVGRRVSRVHGIDVSPSMVEQAEKGARAAGAGNVTFEVADLLEYDAGEPFDVVVSNSTMHWIRPEERAYRQLFGLLRRGGRLGVHQGGQGNYRGLHAFTLRLLKDLDLHEHVVGWRYPTYYPTVEQYRELLAGVGFDDIAVKSVVSDGSDYKDLARDFSEAGLLPYLQRLPEVHRESFRTEWLEEAESSHLDLYTHRLYATAIRP